MEESFGLPSPHQTKAVACIPAFNAAKSLVSVIIGARRYVDEVIVINDGSFDNTKDVLKAGARVVDHAVNLGYGGPRY